VPGKAASWGRLEPGVLSALERVLDACGWDQAGGRLLRADGDQGAVIGRTSWIARAPWWEGRPEGLTERRAHQVVRLALAGALLGARQRRYLAWLLDVARAEAEADRSDNTRATEAAAWFTSQGAP
jgi:hypothetical protein